MQFSGSPGAWPAGARHIWAGCGQPGQARRSRAHPARQVGRPHRRCRILWVPKPVGAENPVTLPDLDVRIIAAHAGAVYWARFAAKGRVRHGWRGVGVPAVRARGPGDRAAVRVAVPAAGSGWPRWYVRLELPGGLDGRRRWIRRGGYPSRKAALEVLARLRNPKADQAAGWLMWNSGSGASTRSSGVRSSAAARKLSNSGAFGRRARVSRPGARLRRLRVRFLRSPDCRLRRLGTPHGRGS
jgi:hypothetical protein